MLGTLSSRVDAKVKRGVKYVLALSLKRNVLVRFQDYEMHQ